MIKNVKIPVSFDNRVESMLNVRRVITPILAHALQVIREIHGYSASEVRHFLFTSQCISLLDARCFNTHLLS